jgi:carboxyl-terminal processing protease
MRRPKPHRTTLWLLPLVAALVGAPAAAQLRCESIPKLADEYLKHHVALRSLTPDIQARTIDTYVLRVDPSRTLLLQSDADEIRKELSNVFDRLKKGDCAPLIELHQKMAERHAAAEDFVRKTVTAPDFELDENVELILDPEERGHPKTAAERDALMVALVNFQLSNYLSAGENFEEAKRRLVHRYELRTRRMKELDEVDIMSGFLDSFAASLDPHSNYFSADVLEDFRISMSLSLEGIGVALSERDGYSVVERIIPGGAADRLEHGLQPKDKIIAVAEDGGEFVNIIDMPLRDAVSLIRGKKGTKVRLTVLRQGEKTERFTLAIVRDKIDLAEQAAKLRYETRQVGDQTYKLAVIELPSFYGDSDPAKRQCTDDLEKLLAEVNESGADGLLLDLSRNGGGLLEHAVKISGFFIRKGEIVGVENSRGQLQILSDRDDRILYSGPMVVHTSRVSASASEILAGALKDYRRAIITGDDHTFGKGTVQTVTPLPPGEGALKITTALFFRPGGKSTQKDGVEADIVIPSLLATNDYGESNQRYALPGERIAPFLSSYANAIGPRDRWSRVGASTVGELSRMSGERIESSEDFAEIREKIAEAQKNDGVVRLSDILKEREQAKIEEENGTEDAATGEKEGDDAGEGEVALEPLSPQTEEALNILTDLVAISHRGMIARKVDGTPHPQLPE